MSARRIYLNQDDAAFTRCHPLEDMTREGAERLVDFYAESSQLAGLAFCVNMQRALFPSRTWETLIQGFDPSQGREQPFFQQSGEAAGTAMLALNGVDQFVIWLERSRARGIEAFLSMRMNDCHGLESHGGFNGDHEKGKDQDHYHWHATEYWKKNPHLRRAPYRYERSFEGAFDYSHKEVRQHHLNLIAEVFERYDMDGFEMDWMRWVFMFAPGSEARGRDLLGQFLEEVDGIRKMAEIRHGHSIQLRHRIPADPQACLALGFDVPAWAESGLADQIILSCFGGAANFNYQIPLWRRLVGSSVKILAQVEAVVSAYPGQSVENYHFAFAGASAALQRQADGIYLFNECYREVAGVEQRRLLRQMLSRMGSAASLKGIVRRYPVTYTQIYAPGDGCRAVLPIPLRNVSIGSDAGRWAQNVTLRIPIGELCPSAGHFLRLGFSGDSPLDELKNITVRVNTNVVHPAAEPEYDDCMTRIFPKREFQKVARSAKHLFHYEIPASALHDDVNVVEFVPPPARGQLEWAEIIVIPQFVDPLI